MHCLINSSVICRVIIIPAAELASSTDLWRCSPSHKLSLQPDPQPLHQGAVLLTTAPQSHCQLPTTALQQGLVQPEPQHPSWGEAQQEADPHLVEVTEFPEEDKELLMELYLLGRVWQVGLDQRV